MSKTLLIVFVKNLIQGKVKTRLAKTIGDNLAFEVYKQLVCITEDCSKDIASDKHIYFSEEVVKDFWADEHKFVQKGTDLGERMQNAFEKGFIDGYEKIILIGSDLPDISSTIINEGFEALATDDVVFGPAEDGGYYLVGMRRPHFSVFQNKEWSTQGLLSSTLSELKENGVNTKLLPMLNDIDTFEDLKSSKIYNNEKYHINIL